MKLWIDAQLSPVLALWVNESFENYEASSVKAVGLRDATDISIYKKAKDANAIILSKDYDFVNLINQYGSPPKLIWITSGNTSNAHMKELLLSSLQKAVEILNQGESIVEIREK